MKTIDHHERAPSPYRRQLQDMQSRLASLMKPGGTLRRLLLEKEDNSFQMASLFDYYDLRDQWITISNDKNSADPIDLIIQLDRLNKVIKYFEIIDEKHEYKRVMKIYKDLQKKLIVQSEEILKKYDEVLPANELLNLCQITEPKAIASDSQKAIDLGNYRIIFDYFKELGFRQGFIDCYAKKRGNIIVNSLQNLLQHLQNACVRRLSINVDHTRQYSPLRRLSQSHEHVKLKVNGVVDRVRRLSIHVVEGVPLKSSPSSKRQTGKNFLDIDSIAPSSTSNDKLQTDQYKFLLDGFVALLYHESDLLFYCFPRKSEAIVFEKIVEISLSFLIKEAEKVCQTIRHLPDKLSSNRNHLFGLLSVLQWFLKSQSKFDKLWHETEFTSNNSLTKPLTKIFEKEVIKCLRLLLPEVENDATEPTPDGTVHSLTLDSLTFMRGLLNYENIFAHLHLNDDDNKPQSTTASSLTNGSAYFDFSGYLVKLVKALSKNLGHKRDMYSSTDDQRTLQVIFLLNNIHYILNELEQTSLLTIIKRTEPDFHKKLADQIDKFIIEYTKRYSPLIIAMQQMLQYDQNHRKFRQTLNDRARQQFKESFSHVNTLIDNIRPQTTHFVIPDVQLRDRLRTEMKNLILTTFTNYYGNLTAKSFTKHPEKYLRYDPSMVESLLNNLFE